MNIFNILLLFSVIFTTALGIIVFVRNHKNKTNQVFAVLSFLVAFSSFIGYQISIAHNEDEVYSLLKMVSLRMLIFPLAIHFFLLLADQKKLLKGFWIYLLLYLFPAILIFTADPHGLFNVHYFGKGMGWDFHLKETMLGTAMAIFIIMLIILLIILGIRLIIRSRDNLRRRQAWFVLLGFVILLLFPVIFDILLPEILLIIPQTTSVTSVLGYSVIAYAILRYELFSPTPESAVGDILKTVTDAVILTDIYGKITFINNSAGKLSNYSEQELLSRNFNDLFTIKMIDEIITHKSGSFDNTLITSNGIKIPVIVSHTELKHGSRRVNGYAFIIHDITYLKNLIHKVSESEMRYKNIFENIQSVYFETTIEGTILEVSPSVEVITSYKRAELLGQNTSILFPDNSIQMNFRKQIMKDHKVNNFEIILKDKSGSYDYCLISARLIMQGNLPEKLVGSITTINDFKKAELLSIENEKKYRLVSENSSVLITQQTEDGTFLYISPNLSFLGYSSDEFLGKSIIEIIHPADQAMVENAVRIAFAEKHHYLVEYRMRNADGNFIWVETQGNYIADKGKNYVISSTRDISKRKQIEFHLKESEERYRVLFEKSPSGIMLMKDLYTPISANEAVLTIFGNQTLESFIKLPLIAYALPDDQKKMIEHDRLRKVGIPVDNRSEIKIRRADGQIRYVEYIVHEILIFEDHFMQVIMNDITEKVESELRLIESEQKYSLLVENSPDDIFLFNEKLEFIMTNEHAAQSLATTVDQIKGKLIYDIFPHAIAEKQALSIKKVFSTGKLSEHIKTFTHTAKGERWYSTILVPVKNELQQVTSVMGIGRDITEIEKAELKIRQNEEKYRLFLENFQGIAFRIGLNNKLEFLYGDVFNITGYTIEEYFEEVPKIMKMIHSEDRKQIFKAYTMLTKIPNSKIINECRIYHRDGSIRYIKLFMQNMMDDEGNPAFIQAALFDKTDNYDLQNKIINSILETENRERIRFAEDLHDDLGPLLSSIRIYTNLIQTKKPDQEKERNELIEFTKQLVDDAILRTKNIAYNIMPEILHQYGLIPSIKSFCSKINIANEIRIEIQTDYIKENERFDGKIELAIYRALKELIYNTMKHAHADIITIRFNKADGFPVVEYSDNGIGLNVEEKIKEGTTLGIRNIFHRIQSVNGTVHFTSAPGKGIRVLIKW